jgi:putative transcription factor
MNQQQLAQAVNEKQSVIADYEAGRAIPNPQIISKLERALGVHLPRDKKKKVKETTGGMADDD